MHIEAIGAGIVEPIEVSDAGTSGIGSNRLRTLGALCGDSASAAQTQPGSEEPLKSRLKVDAIATRITVGGIGIHPRRQLRGIGGAVLFRDPPRAGTGFHHHSEPGSHAHIPGKMKEKGGIAIIGIARNRSGKLLRRISIRAPQMRSSSSTDILGADPTQYT